MTTINIKYRAAAEGKDGKIYFQITHDGKTCVWHPHLHILPWEWDANKGTVVLPIDPPRRAALLAIREQLRWNMVQLHCAAAKLISQSIPFTAHDIIREYTRQKNKTTFFNFMESIIVRLIEMGKQRTSETYRTALNSLSRFRNGQDISLDEFDCDLMEKYEAHLAQQGLIPNSRSFHMRILRAVYNRAVEKELTVDKHPFRHVYTGVDKTAKRAIGIAMVKKIKNLDLRNNPKADYARDMFMLSFYFRGMSFVDMAFLRKKDLANGELTYRRRKTGQKLTIKWTKQMSAILAKYPPNPTEYLLPIITSAAKPAYSQYRSVQFLINKGLKKVADSAGLKMSLSLYCSRHSWASIAKSQGIPVGVISDGLGHDSELTTQIYLSTLDTSAVDNANSMIIDLLTAR